MTAGVLSAPRFPDGTVEPIRDPSPAAPRLGLALGGGSARGWAHLGVLQAFEEAGLVPDIIAGTSIGAVVGAAYAAGKLSSLTEFALSLTRRRVVGLIDLRLTGSGLIAGERLARRLVRELGTLHIEALPIPFGCVATEHRSGHEVWLTRGPLVDALRASYAIPGIFPPVALDSRILMDGTLVNPVPVKLARELGAEVVICVNLGGDPRVRGSVIRPELAGPVAIDAAEDESGAEAVIAEAVEVRGRWALLRGIGLPSVGPRSFKRFVRARAMRKADPGTPGAARILLDAFNITQDRLWRERYAVDPPDVTITPPLAGIGLFDFHRAAEALVLGREAGRVAIPEIVAMVEGASARACTEASGVTPS